MEKDDFKFLSTIIYIYIEIYFHTWIIILLNWLKASVYSLLVSSLLAFNVINDFTFKLINSIISTF